uniref:Uncharacterized protein n=1 Tax=Coccidioides posadasii RMSCC 3488 TaxID=454284 RepID=A0A0J6FA18_COCPO|nr:hypothetical protein CPAG_06204 [Coccidioides posadasii RMSCC 3488]
MQAIEGEDALRQVCTLLCAWPVLNLQMGNEFEYVRGSCAFKGSAQYLRESPQPMSRARLSTGSFVSWLALVVRAGRQVFIIIIIPAPGDIASVGSVSCPV